MSAESQDLAQWLLTQIAEDEKMAAGYEGVPLSSIIEYAEDSGPYWLTISARRVLAECEAKRAIIEWHKNWPVLVETPPNFEPTVLDDPQSMTLRMTKQIAWLTQQQYRERFGDEPPTAPMLRHLAAVYADRPGYREEWRPN